MAANKEYKDDTIANLTELRWKYNLKPELVRRLCSELPIVSNAYRGKYYNLKSFESKLKEYYSKVGKSQTDEDLIDGGDLNDELKKLKVKSLRMDIAERESNLVPHHKVVDFFKKHVSLFAGILKDICFAYAIPAEKYNQYVTNIKTEIGDYIREYDLSKIMDEDMVSEAEESVSGSLNYNVTNEQAVKTTNEDPSI